MPVPQDVIDRVDAERQELEDKLSKLIEYRRSGYPHASPKQIELMREQEAHMWKYDSVLCKRINDMKK